ncbi:Outer membrane pore protein E precursor [Luteitalea pratensis]|uniref:Outer membrane pore protein E n=1 Tax=Luteitalea pratensis TaxID=1855912 RepID=A0A143PMR9_LUTPR|nr:porin [Luteitalea pratensis]AMY09074.1 Outer membrane pore protein E precursor [Luteitalea pratensis]
MHHASSIGPLPSALGMSILLCLAGALLPASALARQSQGSQSAATVITCVSTNAERKVCPADTAAGVALLRSTGQGTCLLGKTWGYDTAGIWVTESCGGEFALGATAEATGGDEFVGTFEPYGQLRTHLAAYDDTAEVQDNATRVGINFRTRGSVKMFAGTEWGVNLVQSDTQFNLSASGNGDFGVVETDTSPVFIARLGFIGVDFGPVGRVAIGKQGSVHYDITSYTTDRFNVFGGQGTSTYVAGTDGGATGTGRADRVVNYRNTLFKILDVGVQGQFRGGKESDGAGGSVQLTVLPGVKFGGAYTHTNWSQNTRNLVQGLRGDGEYAALGTRIDWRAFQMGLVYSHQDNGDMVQVPFEDIVTPVAFDADGVELFLQGRIKRLGLIGGFTYQDPKVRDTLLDPDFNTKYAILGAEWFVARTAKIYTESKIDLDSVSPTGASGDSVFTIGFRYDFAFRVSHK